MLEKFFGAAGAVLAIVAGTALFAMMALTFADVIGRYGFNKSVFGTAEWIETLMVLAIFAGIAFITATNDHITVTMFDGWIVRNIPNVRRWAVVVFSIICYFVIIWELYKHAIDMWVSDKRTVVVSLPQWIQPGGAAVLSTIGLILIILGAWKTRGHVEKMKPLLGFSQQDDVHKGAGN